MLSPTVSALPRFPPTPCLTPRREGARGRVRAVPALGLVVCRAVPWRHKAFARTLLEEAEDSLEDGNFPQVEQNCHVVHCLADGWQPPRSTLLAFALPQHPTPVPVPLDCPLSVQALRLRMLARLLLKAEDLALEDAQELKKTRRWASLAELVEAVCWIQLGHREKVRLPEDLEPPGELGLAWRRVQLVLGSGEAGEPKGVDVELERSCWFAASVLPPALNYVHPDLEVVVFQTGQRGVQVTAELPRGTLLMLAGALVFQGPAARPALPRRLAPRDPKPRRNSPEQLVKVFHDPTAPMQKALQTAAKSSAMRSRLSQLSDGVSQPEVRADVLQDLCAPFQSGRLSMKSSFTAQELFGILKTNGFNCEGQAWGLWGTISFVNHSCCPTAHYVVTEKHEGSALDAQQGGTMVLRSAVDMKPGDEVTFEYFGAQHAMMDLEHRREITEKHGADGFRCACRRCMMEEQGLPFCPSTELELLEMGAPASMEHLEALDECDRLEWLKVRYGHDFSPQQLDRLHRGAKASAFPAHFVRLRPRLPVVPKKAFANGAAQRRLT